MALKHTVNFILNHPLNKRHRLSAVFRFLKWQIKSRIYSGPHIYPICEKSSILVEKGLTGATGNLYSGLHEFEDMGFLLHFLKPSDLFVDLGANIGSYSILGASECEAETISIEPIPKTFKRLVDNIKLNKVEDRVTCYNIGLGSETGILKFTKDLDTVNHVAKPSDKNTIEVPIKCFDDIKTLKKPTLVKIDLEGYETEVLKGMKNALADANF